MFRRSAPTQATLPAVPPAVSEKRYQLNLIPECSLTVSNGPERRKHLALLGDADWTNYWFLDALAQSATAGLRSFVLSGPADERLRGMPDALGLPPSLSEVRNTLPYALDPGTLRQRLESFMTITSDDELSLILLGRDLTHIWPFVLGRKENYQSKLMFLIADMTGNLKLPLSQSFRYFLVQNTHQAAFEKAVERWHRHDSDRPRFVPSEVPRQKCTLYEVKDPI